MIEIREAGNGDLDALVRLGLGIQSLHADARADIFGPPDAAALTEFFGARLGGDDFVVVAELDGSVVGYVLAEHQVRGTSPFKRASSILYVHHIAVDPDSRGKGVGRALMAATDDRARRLGATAVRLDSWQFNADAHEFFRREGFEPLNVVFEKSVR